MTIDQAVKKLFEDEIGRRCEIHALTVYKNGEKIVSYAPAPYSVHQKNHVYSLSKSFCSTAVGIACDMGYLSLDDKIIDIFPEKCPEEISEYLASMTLRHVLSMNTGHDGCRMNPMVNSDDPVATFMAQRIDYAPGTHFAYNTGATYLASAALTKKTGLSTLEFLELYLFPELDIKCSEWYSHCGISEGGVGFHVSCDDAAKLGLLYLNGGVWNGKRLLSEEYVKEATSYISDNSTNGNSDWCAGYGLQFWRGARSGFRGDGAFGQLSMVLPEKNIVVSVIAECGDMQVELDRIYELVDNIESCPDGDRFTGDFELYPADDFSTSDVIFAGKSYKLDENKCLFSVLRFETRENRLDIFLSSAGYVNRISLRPNEWVNGRLRGKFVKPALEALTVNYGETLEFAACARNDGNKLVVTLRALNCPHRITYTFEPDGENIKISRRTLYNRDHDGTFTGKEI